eukprot:358904-Chlamydomonas_euryale.AAC.1
MALACGIMQDTMQATTTSIVGSVRIRMGHGRGKAFLQACCKAGGVCSLVVDETRHMHTCIMSGNDSRYWRETSSRAITGRGGRGATGRGEREAWAGHAPYCPHAECGSADASPLRPPLLRRVSRFSGAPKPPRHIDQQRPTAPTLPRPPPYSTPHSLNAPPELQSNCHNRSPERPPSTAVSHKSEGEGAPSKRTRALDHAHGPCGLRAPRAERKTA